jgi:hypothetical protein
MYSVDGLEEYEFVVKEAVVTNKRIAFDWVADGSTMYAVLHSTDGGTQYAGTFGTHVREKGCVMEATRFQSKSGEVLLWLTWHREDDGNGGTIIIHLAAEWES